jgi:pimeloyl-ACP methyl ester carboxylesterase
VKNVVSVLVLLALTAGCVSLTPYEDLVAGLPGERLLSLDAGQVYVEDQGRGEAVVLVHGFGASSFAWRHVSAALEHDFRVVAIDLAGFGFTQRPRDKASYSRFAQGQLVLAVMDRLGIARAHLVGHSYGGSVSMALAARSPERFFSLTLVNSAALDYPQARRTAAASFLPLASLLVRTHSLRRSNVEAKLKRSAADDSVVTEAVVDEYWRRLKVEGSPRAFWGLTTPLEDPQTAVGLGDITLPTLVVWGVRDELIDVEAARRATTRIPASRFAEIEDAGHVPMEERPEELVGLMRLFLESGLSSFD